MILTCALFVHGYRHNDPLVQNKMMRARVKMQAFTFGVMFLSDFVRRHRKRKERERIEIMNFVDDD